MGFGYDDDQKEPPNTRDSDNSVTREEEACFSEERVVVYGTKPVGYFLRHHKADDRALTKVDSTAMYIGERCAMSWNRRLALTP